MNLNLTLISITLFFFLHGSIYSQISPIKVLRSKTGIVALGNFNSIEVTDLHAGSPRKTFNKGNLGGGMGLRVLFPLNKNEGFSNLRGELTLGLNFNSFSTTSSQGELKITQQGLRITPVLFVDAKILFLSFGVDGVINWKNKVKLNTQQFDFKNFGNIKGIGRFGLPFGKSKKIYAYGEMSYQIFPIENETGSNSDVLVKWNRMGFGFGIGYWIWPFKN